tara:strand:+ start:367 stop:1542 length:1176 start_codon:yes stop_codon:yes gene_type:complete
VARFGQQFLAGLLRPSYEQGMFTVGAELGALPARRRELQKQQEEMQKLRGMGAVERAEFMAQRAQTPDELLKAEAAKDSAMKQSAMQSLRGLEAARQAAETDEEKLRIENIMTRVAVQAEVDPASIAGRTQKEKDAVLRRENAKVSAELNAINLQAKQREQQEDALKEAYFSVPENSREAFEKNLTDSGFSSVIQDVKAEKLREETANLNYVNALQRKQDSDAQKATSLATSALESSIDSSNIDTDLKKNLKERLSRIKQPNFEAGETWNSGDKENAIREFNAINNLLSQAVVTEATNKRREADRLKRLKDYVAKYVPTESAIDEFDGFFTSREDAIKMAREQALAPLLAEIKLLEEGQPIPEFATIEEAEQAGLPTGTEIIVGGRKAVVE